MSASKPRFKRFGVRITGLKGRYELDVEPKHWNEAQQKILGEKGWELINALIEAGKKGGTP